VSDAHEAWVDRCARWGKLYDEKCAEVERLENVIRAVELTYTEEALRARCESLRALVSWIDGMCVDCADHAEIRAGIYAALEAK
jgi:hypothetical protein